MVAMLDLDQSGKLGYEEFEALLTDIAKWKAVFKLYDKEGCGRMHAFDLRQALNSAGYRLNNRLLNALAHRYGSRDGTIAFDDFIMCAVKIKTYIGKQTLVFQKTFVNEYFPQTSSRNGIPKEQIKPPLVWTIGLKRQFIHNHRTLNEILQILRIIEQICLKRAQYKIIVLSNFF